MTYNTVRTVARPALPQPNLIYCRPGDPAVAEPPPRPLDPTQVSWAVSLGLPSPDPDEWRADVLRAKSKIRPAQILIVSVVGTPVPGGLRFKTLSKFGNRGVTPGGEAYCWDDNFYGGARDRDLHWTRAVSSVLGWDVPCRSDARSARDL